METLKIPRTAYAAFNLLPEGTCAQIINDTIIMSPAPSEAHQRMINYLSYQLNKYLEQHQLGRIYTGPFDVELDKRQVYQPDILYISNENAGIIHHDRIYGAPDMVIEILSPGTAGYDRHEKLNAYQQYGVKEYWLVEVYEVTATGYILENGFFRQIARDPVINFNCFELKVNLKAF